MECLVSVVVDVVVAAAALVVVVVVVASSSLAAEELDDDDTEEGTSPLLASDVGVGERIVAARDGESENVVKSGELLDEARVVTSAESVEVVEAPRLTVWPSPLVLLLFPCGGNVDIFFTTQNLFN